MTNDDRAEIIEIINLYAFALDTHQWDLFDRVFTQDVVAVYGPAGAGWNGLTIFKASFAEFHVRLDSHQHTMMSHLVVADGDTAHARPALLRKAQSVHVQSVRNHFLDHLYPKQLQSIETIFSNLQAIQQPSAVNASME